MKTSKTLVGLLIMIPLSIIGFFVISSFETTTDESIGNVLSPEDLFEMSIQELMEVEISKWIYNFQPLQFITDPMYRITSEIC